MLAGRFTHRVDVDAQNVAGRTVRAKRLQCAPRSVAEPHQAIRIQLANEVIGLLERLDRKLAPFGLIRALPEEDARVAAVLANEGFQLVAHTRLVQLDHLAQKRPDVHAPLVGRIEIAGKLLLSLGRPSSGGCAAADDRHAPLGHFRPAIAALGRLEIERRTGGKADEEVWTAVEHQPAVGGDRQLHGAPALPGRGWAAAKQNHQKDHHARSANVHPCLPACVEATTRPMILRAARTCARLSGTPSPARQHRERARQGV